MRTTNETLVAIGAIASIAILLGSMAGASTAVFLTVCIGAIVLATLYVFAGMLLSFRKRGTPEKEVESSKRDSTQREIDDAS